MIKKRVKKKSSSFFTKRWKKVCRFCSAKIKEIDYKEIEKLNSFLKEGGTIISRRNSGTCAKHQRKLSKAIKQARFVALLPYIKVE